jgi:hypothetical protein
MGVEKGDFRELRWRRKLLLQYAKAAFLSVLWRCARLNLGE